MTDESTTLPWTTMTLATARTQLTGLHFAKDAMSDGEREILYIAEALLRQIDATPKQMLLVSFVEKPEPDVQIPDRHVGLVSSIEQATRAILGDLDKRPRTFSIGDFIPEHDAPEAVFTAVLHGGVPTGDFYTVTPVPVV